MKFAISTQTNLIIKAVLFIVTALFTQAVLAVSINCATLVSVATSFNEKGHNSYELALAYRAQGKVAEAAVVDRIEETFLSQSQFELVTQINPSVQIVKDIKTGQIAIFKVGDHYPNIAILEVFAYKLDRYLGLGRAPVAIPKIYNGVNGVMISFIHGRLALHDFLNTQKITEVEHLAKTQAQANTGEVYFEFWNYLETWGREIHFFDLILSNRDRHPENVILLTDSAKTRAPIDYANSLEKPRFVLETSPPQILLYGGRNQAGTYMPVPELLKVPHEVLSKYFALDSKALDTLFPGLLTDAQKEVFLAQQTNLRSLFRESR